MLYNLHFFPSKCHLFHNATLFGFCITHILNTGCAKIWRKKIRRQKVKVASSLKNTCKRFVIITAWFLVRSQRMVGEWHLLASTHLSACNNFGTFEKILIKINNLHLQLNRFIHTSTYYSRTRTTVGLYEGLQASLHASRAQLSTFLSDSIVTQPHIAIHFFPQALRVSR